jgi:hypothetical protein
MGQTSKPREMNSTDLVEYLHPADAPSRQHTISAAYQVKDLLQYLATVTGEASDAALPSPVVASDVVLAIRDGLPAMADLLRNLGHWTQAISPDSLRRAASETAAALDQAADHTAALHELLDDAADRATQVWSYRP